MIKAGRYIGPLLLTALLVLAGCTREVERPKAVAPTIPAATPVTAVAPSPTPTAVLPAAPVPAPASAAPSPEPTATIMPPSTPIPVATPTRTPTTVPTPVRTATPMALPSPTPTVPPIATPTLPPAPTATPPLPGPSPTPSAAPDLVLDVQGPADGSAVKAGAVVVHGITTPGALVRISGQAASVGTDGRFQLEVVLTEGANAINVTATDAADNRESVDLTVTYVAPAPLPFVLVITEPVDQSVVTEATVKLSGRTGPEAVVTVRGVSVPVDDLGIFSTALTLEPGPNITDVVATNNDRRILSTVIAVIYRPR